MIRGNESQCTASGMSDVWCDRYGVVVWVGTMLSFFSCLWDQHNAYRSGVSTRGLTYGGLLFCVWFTVDTTNQNVVLYWCWYGFVGGSATEVYLSSFDACRSSLGVRAVPDLIV